MRCVAMKNVGCARFTMVSKNALQDLDDSMVGRSREYSPVASWLDKVDASVYTVVLQLVAVDTVLLLEVVVETRFNVFNDGLPAVVEVDQCTKSEEEASQPLLRVR